MSAAEALVRKLLELAGSSPSAWTLALGGPGLEELPERIDTAHGMVSIARPTTEVELRHFLWRANGAPVLAIVPHELAARLPPDLVRPATKGRVHALDVGEVLSAFLHTPVVGVDDAETQQLALAHLDALQAAVSSRTLPTVIDRRTLDELLLDVTVGRRVRTEAPGALLADWYRSPPMWPGDVKSLVLRSLPSLHATEGLLLEWALRNDLVREVIVHGTLLEIESELAQSVWGPLAGARESLGLPADVLRRSFAEITKQALASLSPAEKGPLLNDAGRLASKLMLQSDIAKSKLLPLGLEVLCHDIAHQAAKGVGVPVPDVRRMHEHSAAALYRDDIVLLESMARLARWLATPPTSLGDGVVEHVRAYQRDAAFADRAAAQVRRAMSRTQRYEAQARDVLRRWETRRNAGNEAFAATLQAGYVTAVHARGLVGVHNLWQEHVAGEIRRADAERSDTSGGIGGAYVVVLDGCSYSVFLELLDELANDAGAPIGLRGGEDGAVPAISLLPSITSHARSAIFLGQIPKDPWLSESTFRDGERTTDPGRFRQNPKLGGPDGESRKLFLKADLASGPQPLLAAIDDPALRVVAVVFNAIDDQIGSTNTGAMVKIHAGDITGLVPSIRRALDRRRAVVVTADHGHTPFLDPDHKVGPGETPRFAELGPRDPVPEGFVEIDVSGLAGGRERCAFAWKVGVYRGLPQAGFHGGCALEEMVIPLATLVSGGVPADRPLWWDDAGDAAELRSTPAAPTTKKRREPGAGQLQLLATPANLDLDAGILAALTDDERRALGVLRAAGAARQSELASALQRPVARMAGFMAQLHKKLHGLGVEIVRTERLASGEANYTWLGPRSGV